MAHELNPSQDNPLLEIGRLIHENSYSREKKGFETLGMKIDLIRKKGGRLIVAEVKKTSRFLKSATMQLAYYLFRLREMGIKTSGELLIPKEKKRIKVELTPELEQELESAFIKMREITSNDRPPPAKKIGFCTRCAYREFCWG